MPDLVTTIELDAEQVGTEILAFLKTVDQDVVVLWSSLLAAFRQGNVAGALVPLAGLLKDAQAGLAALEKDAAALVPADVKAFLNDGQTLKVDIGVPFVGNVTGVLYKGTHTDLIAAVAAGKTTF